MSMVDKVVKAVVDKLRAQGLKPRVSRLISDWGLAEQVLGKYLVNSILLGLNELPQGPGNLLLFSRSPNPVKAVAQLEIGGGWIWEETPLASLQIEDSPPFPERPRSALISQSQQHASARVTAIRLWQPVPHLAIEFSDRSVLAIHGDCGPHESWGFDDWGPDHMGVFALPGGPIAVG